MTIPANAINDCSHTQKDADSLILEIVDAAARPGELIVVTSDKPVYSYARTRGARALTAREWNELGRQAGARRKPGRSQPKEKPDHEPDVEGWLKRFSRE